MPFKLICSCKLALLAPDGFAQKSVRCPECGFEMALPKIPNPSQLPVGAELVPVGFKESPSRSGLPPAKNVTRRGRSNQNRKAVQKRTERRSEPQKEVSTANQILVAVLIILVIAMGVVGFFALNP